MFLSLFLVNRKNQELQIEGEQTKPQEDDMDLVLPTKKKKPKKPDMDESGRELLENDEGRNQFLLLVT